MDYEKEYKRIVGKIKNAYLYAQTDSTKAVLEEIIPELAESEDERIRKAIIEHFSRKKEVEFPELEEKYNTWIAWLEKQGHEPKWCHHKVDLSNCSEEYRKAYYDGWNNCNMQHSQCESEKSDVLKCLINGMKFYYEDNEEATWGTQKFSMKVKDILDWLEKQGEHANFRDKIQVGDKVTRNEAGILVNLSQLNRVAKKNEKQGEQKASYTTIVETGNGGINSLVTRELPTDSEQKPANKVEPKFKVGDWIVDKSGFTQQVLDFRAGIYTCTYNSFTTDCESNYHLWTIADAGNGDVLSYVTDEEDLWIMIYWSLYEPYEGHVHYHALLINDNFSDKGTCCICIDNLKPATKEQRSLLFCKMKEAGYEWDCEKKELRRIEQRPTDKIKPFDKYEGLTNFERTLADICIGWIGEELGWKQYIKDNADVLLKIAIKKFNSVQDVPFGQKPTEWSEEDKELLKWSINNLTELKDRFGEEYGKVGKCIDWLKSLKDRVGCEANCTTTKEWSEDDEQYVEDLSDYFTGGLSLKHSEEDIVAWLKSLRPQK